MAAPAKQLRNEFQVRDIGIESARNLLFKVIHRQTYDLSLVMLDLFVGHVGSAISKRKQLVSADFVSS